MPESTASPEQVLSAIFALVERTDSDDELAEIGAGPLENLLRQHEDELWPEIEALARESRRFRRCLRSVWIQNSEQYERRERLLFELGEWVGLTVCATIYNDELSGSDMRFRNLRVEWVPFSDREVADVLRLIARKLDPPTANE